MKMRKFYMVICIILCSVVTYGQAEIDYQNKRIQRSLQKFDISDFHDLREISYDDSLTGQQIADGKFFELADDAGIHPVQYIYIGRVNSCRGGGCTPDPGAGADFSSEYFDYFMLLDSTLTVQLVEVFNYQATHGYEITSRGWLKQFRGFDGSNDLRVNKNIDALTGATISVHAITDDIKTKVGFLHLSLTDRYQ
ncbi:MAG: FMN-binding protein [Bacteroidales bacterium]